MVELAWDFQVAGQKRRDLGPDFIWFIYFPLMHFQDTIRCLEFIFLGGWKWEKQPEKWTPEQLLWSNLVTIFQRPLHRRVNVLNCANPPQEGTDAAAKGG